MADTLDDPATEFESTPEDSLSDSAPESDDLGSLESEGESDRENHGSDRLPPGKFTANTIARVCTNAKSRCLKRKEPSSNGSLPKRIRQERGLSSADSAGASDQLPYEEEVKSALKEITSILNTVVQRVERVENELQRQKSTDPSSSSDVTPTRTKPPLAVKVSLLHPRLVRTSL